MDWKTLFLTAEGRIGKRDFWLGMLILFGVALVASLIPVLGALVHLALIYPGVCLYSKRLHDFGKTGWLQVVPMAVSLVGGVLIGVLGGAAMVGGLASGSEPFAAGAMLASLGLIGLVCLAVLAVGVGFLLWTGLSNGDAGDNRFGPPPAPLIGGQPSTVA